MEAEPKNPRSCAFLLVGMVMFWILFTAMLTGCEAPDSDTLEQIHLLSQILASVSILSAMMSIIIILIKTKDNERNPSNRNHDQGHP